MTIDNLVLRLYQWLSCQIHAVGDELTVMIREKRFLMNKSITIATISEMQSIDRCFFVLCVVKKSFKRECELSCLYLVSFLVHMHMNQRTIIDPETLKVDRESMKL